MAGPAGDTAKVTYAGQESLKRLPIPALEETLERYLLTVKPYQSRSEFKATEIAVKEFAEKDGPALQRRLLDYDKTQVSYIEQFWFDSYLNYDNPVVLNLNPFFLLEDDPTPARANQVTRAASLAISSLCFVRCLRREELPADSIRGSPLCMYQYSRMFGTSRIATASGCQMRTDPASKHIVVLCRSQFYWFDVLDANSDIIVSEAFLAENFKAIIDDASSISASDAAKQAVGVLTSESRSVWAGLRQVINDEKKPNNRECLEIIDSALFIVCLDDSEPVGKAAVSENMLCGSYELATGVQSGTCTNRWYDKLQLIVCKNGSAGINFEHTGVDGHTVLRFVSDIYTDTIMRFAKTINPAAPNLWPSMSPDPSKRDPDSFGDVDSTPHKLEWDVTPDLATAIRFAETRLSDLIQQNELAVLEFAGYGSNFMKAAGFSPDAFVQMAFQAAYYGLYGRVQSVYEPAMTKGFLHGRTEAIRSTTTESVNFIQRFCEAVSPQIKVDALKKACLRHTAITREAGSGKGLDRHLYALYKMWEMSLAEHKSNHASATANGKKSNTKAEQAATQSVETAQGNEVNGANGVVIQRSTSNTSLDSPSPPSPASSPSPSQSSASDDTTTDSLPSLFADSAWTRLNHTTLSTSNCGNPALRMFGFGPTSADGFGIGYIIKDSSISICAASKHRQTKRYLDTLAAYFLEMRALLRTSDALRGTEKERVRPEDKQSAGRRNGSGSGSSGRNTNGGSHGGGGGGGARGEGRARSGRPVYAVAVPNSQDEDDGDGMLSGYGYFDFEDVTRVLNITSPGAGAGGAADDDGGKGESRGTGNEARRHAIGKRLRLSEY